MKTNKLAALGCVFTGFSVLLGAFGAHALKSQLSPYALSIFETGVLYQFLHGLGLIVLATWQRAVSERMLTIASGFLIVGVVCFSGSLYGLALSNWTWLWPITPIGGTSLLIGWGLAAVCLWRSQE